MATSTSKPRRSATPKAQAKVGEAGLATATATAVAVKAAPKARAAAKAAVPADTPAAQQAAKPAAKKASTARTKAEQGAPTAPVKRGKPTQANPAAAATQVAQVPAAVAAPAPATAPAPAPAPVKKAAARKRGSASAQAATPPSPAAKAAAAIAPTPVPTPAPSAAPPPLAESATAPAAASQRPKRPARQDRPGRPARADQSPQRRPAAASPETAAPVSAAEAAPEAVSFIAPTGPADSTIVLRTATDQHQLHWQPGHACPPALRDAAAAHVDAQGRIAADDDAALPLLMRLAFESGHALTVDTAVWPHLAAHRDARSRLDVLAAAYPDGLSSAGLATLLSTALPAFQAEGALFAVAAGRALIADERGLGKSVQAMAACALWRRHFGVQRILVLCAPAQRATWQRAWARFMPEAETAQAIDGGLHQRQSQWSAAASVRIMSPEALASDAAHAAQWAPDLVIVDEPQGLGLHADDWAMLGRLDAPHALVLSGAPLADQPELMNDIVAWLDRARLGPLAALIELQNASTQGLALTEGDVARLSNSLSRLMLQRQRADLQDQLPPLVHSALVLALAPAQREAHDAALAQAQRLLSAWQASGYLSDDSQWRLATALRAMQQACHRAEPGQPDSALAEATVGAIASQLAAWASTGPLQAAVVCASDADLAQLAGRLTLPEGVQLLGPQDATPAGLDAVLQLGVPWRTRRSPWGAAAGPRAAGSPASQQLLYLVAQDSLDIGLFDTLASRHDLPRSPAEPGGLGFLQGARLRDWLTAVAAALQAITEARAAAD